MARNTSMTVEEAAVAAAQRVVVPLLRRQLLAPVTPPQGAPPVVAPWMELELRLTGCPAVDPDAVVYPPGGADYGHALRMVTAANTSIVLESRDATTGTGWYTAYAPTNPQELLDGVTDPKYAPARHFSAKGTVVPVGYKISAGYEVPGKPDCALTIVGPTVAAATRQLLTEMYRGYPRVPCSAYPSHTTPRGVPYSLPAMGTPGALRYSVGWTTRWLAAYSWVAVCCACALGAGCNAWTTGAYYEHGKDCVLALGYGAAGGSVLKYLGIACMRGPRGVCEALHQGGR
jgi:hypothetical protein